MVINHDLLNPLHRPFAKLIYIYIHIERIELYDTSIHTSYICMMYINIYMLNSPGILPLG